MARLGDVCTKITDGSHNPPQGIPHSEYLMLSSKNIYDDEITLDDPRFLSAENYAIENKRTQISTGDILLTIVGTVGRAAVVSNSTKNICLQRSVAVIKPNSSLIDSRFLMYQLQSMRTHLEQEARGVAQKGIYLKQVENLQVKIPSMDEQFLVVKKLDKVGELITLRKEQLVKLDQLVKSRFIELFGDSVTNSMGWDTDTVIGVCDDIYGGGTPSKSHPEYYENGDIPWVSSKDMKTDVLYDSQIKINQLGVYNSTAKMVPINSVIMVIRSGILKHTLPVAVNAVPITVNQDLKVFIPSNRILSIFLMHQFKMLEKDILSGVRAVTADNIEFDSLKKREIIVPPMELQEQFAAFVEQTDKSKLAIQQSLDKLELLKKSLMQEYFG